MTRLLLIGCLVIGLGGAVCAQTPTWNWAKNLTAPSASLWGVEAATDAAGNIYVVAEKRSSGNYLGMHLGKYDPAGVEIWSVTISNCNPYDLYTDAAGYSYVTGSFYDSATIGTSTFICRGIYDMFIAKFDPSGSVVWARRAGASAYPSNMLPLGALEDQGTFVGADAAGNCYVLGRIIVTDTSAAIFDTIQVNHTGVSALRQELYFLAKYNSTGQIQWVRTMTTEYTYNITMTVSSLGDCLVSWLSGSTTISHSGITINSNSGGPLFYAKFDTNGNVKWVKNTGGQAGLYLGKIAMNQQGEGFITGSFKGTAQIGNFTITCPNNQYMLFVAKCDTSGVIQWVNKTTGSGQSSIDYPSIRIDPNGNSYISMRVDGAIYVGSQGFAQNANQTTYSILTKWSPGGSPLWAVRPTGTINSYGESINGLTLNPGFDKCYVTGHSSSSYTFGTHQVGAGCFLAELGNLVTSSPGELAASSLSFYPNPTSSRTLHFQPGQLTSGVRVQLFNTLGQTVHQFTFTNREQTVIQLPQLPAGAYVLQVQSEQNVYRQKIVLE